MSEAARSSDQGNLGRFLTIADTAEYLNISVNQAYLLVRSGELAAIKIGSRGQWRIERSMLESYIEAKYEEARRLILWNQHSDFSGLVEFSTARNFQG
jgi:excisionase family DNA binding protein